MTTNTLGQQPIDGIKPTDDDLQLWGVTTLLKALSAEGLVYWACQQTADAAIETADYLPQRIETEGRDEVAKWLRDARFRQPKDRRSDADLGTAVHKWLEEYVLSGVRPDADEEMRPMCEALDRWLQEWQPEWHASEVTVYNPDLGYAGTLDGIFTIGGTKVVYDLKTTKNHLDSRGKRKTPYPETALQLAMYRYAPYAAVWRPRRFEKYRRRYYALSPDEVAQAATVPEVDGAVCLHVTPEDALAFPMRADEQVFRYCRYLIGVARWHFQASKDAVGDPLVAPAREEVAS